MVLTIAIILVAIMWLALGAKTTNDFYNLVEDYNGVAKSKEEVFPIYIVFLMSPIIILMGALSFVLYKLIFSE